MVDMEYTRCRCRSQFCYICGLKWKTCSCSSFTGRTTSPPGRRRPPLRRRPPPRRSPPARRGPSPRRPPRVVREEQISNLHGRQENQQRMSTENANSNKAWVCVDVSIRKDFLIGCNACQEGRQYNSLANAAAHLLQAHSKAVFSESPSELLLRGWMREVDAEAPGGDSLSRPSYPVVEATQPGYVLQSMRNAFNVDTWAARQLWHLNSSTIGMAGNGIKIDSNPMKRKLQLDCIHPSMPSLYWQLYTCSLCSGIVFMCDQCRQWACAACGVSTEYPPVPKAKVSNTVIDLTSPDIVDLTVSDFIDLTGPDTAFEVRYSILPLYCTKRYLQLQMSS
jgi:hypothetical protein